MKVFISYGSAADQVTALRLQALGAVHGLTIYVPPGYTRQPDSVVLDAEVLQKLGEADVALGVIGSGFSDACRLELNASLKDSKPVLVMADPQLAPRLQPHFPTNLVVIDPANPGLAEQGIVEHLKAVEAEKKARNALIALGTLALGLLVFAPQD
jgi:hypothetical protein